MAKRVGVDKWLFFTTLSLVVVGLAMVFSASAVVAQAKFGSPYTFLGRQALWALLGVVAMFVLMRVDYRRYNSKRFVYISMGIVFALLVGVFVLPGSHATHRWIRFGPFFTFQPSEIVKPILAIYLAWFLHTRLNQMKDWKHTLLPAVVPALVCIALVVKEPDLGTALVLFGMTLTMLLLAGMEWRYVLGIFAAVYAGCRRASALRSVASCAHEGLSASRGRSTGRGLPYQSVADCCGYRRMDGTRLHGRRAEAFLSA
jgi:cell division protein FtsW